MVSAKLAPKCAASNTLCLHRQKNASIAALHLCEQQDLSILTFYKTIFLSFLIGLSLIKIASKFNKTAKWQHPLFMLAGFAMVGLILWLLLQILIGLPSLDQVVDLPAIFLGLLIAYGFQNAVITIKNRAKNKFK